MCGVFASRVRRADAGDYRRIRVPRVHLSGMDTATAALDAPVFLTQHQLAELLHVPERTLEDWRLTQHGPPYLKLGRHVRYDLDDVVAWAKGHRHA